MNDLDELGDYITKSEDVQLGMMVEIVKEYGNDIPGIIKSIKAKHIENDEKEKAEMIFSTVHRSKGMEYDSVQLVNDFITEEKLEKLKADNRKEEVSISKLNEEINLLYVAITRTRNSIHIPESLMPGDFPVSSHIRIIREFREKERTQDGRRRIEDGGSRIEGRGSRIRSRGSGVGKWEGGNSGEKRRAKGNDKVKEKSYSVENIREKHKAAYQPWTPKLEDELTVMYCEGVNVRDMGKHFGRTRGAIKARIDKVGLEEMYG
jgi:IS30 family transposase